MANNVKISIIIPVYNAEKYLQKCLDSVINQTLKEIEILCINDGSTDNSLSILEEYAKKDRRIKVFTGENQGPAAARNIGLKNATGEYVWFVDADDWCELNACELLYEKAVKDNLDMIIFSALRATANGITNKIKYYSIDSVVPADDMNIIVSINNAYKYIFDLPRESWCRIFRLDKLKKNKITFLDNSYIGDDIFLTTLIALKFNRIGFLNNFLYNYRDTPNSLVYSINDKAVDFLKKTEDLLKILLEDIYPDHIMFFFIKREFHSLLHFLYRKNINNELYYNQLRKFFLSTEKNLKIALLLKQLSFYEQIKDIARYNTFYKYKKYYPNLSSKTKTQEIRLFNMPLHERVKQINEQQNQQILKQYILGIAYYKNIKTQNVKKVYFLGLQLYKKEKISNIEKVFIFGILIKKKKFLQDKIKKYFLGICYKKQSLYKNINEEIKEIRCQILNLKKDIKNQLIISNLHQKTFPQFKDKHIGQDIAVLGAGPSLNFYKPAQNTIHIGVNRVFEFSRVDLDYLFLLDYKNVKGYIDKANVYNYDSCLKFYGIFYEKDHPDIIPDYHAIQANALRYYIGASPCTGFDETIYKDITTCPLAAFRSVIFNAINFAIFTNPKRLYLIGCDCNFSGYWDKTKQDSISKDDFLTINEIKNMEGWRKFKAFAKLHYPHTEIISVNPVGLKGLFEDEIYTEEFLKESLKQ
ncbi:MAG: glycosyltransferase [Campylobacteraceae bacterium]|jgi:glycosyltransferase involved in cell wall biosynthesis|nr:glycosyltransferase [Campylobacteraceae bacterium]